MGLQVDILQNEPITGDDQKLKKQIKRAIAEIDSKAVASGGGGGSFSGSVVEDTPDAPPVVTSDPLYFVIRERLDGETNDGPAFDAALAAAASSAFGGRVAAPRHHDLTLPGGHIRTIGVTVDFGGNHVAHTGNNVMLRCYNPGDFEFGAGRAAVINGFITGNSGANAVALELGNCWGFELRNLTINDYTNGIGIDMHNRINWCEGTVFINVMVNLCKIGVRFIRENTTIVTGQPPTNSFAYTDIQGLQINVPASGVGIDLAGSAGKDIYLYHSFIRATFWLRSGAIGIRASSDVQCDRNTYDLTSEAFATSTFFTTVAGSRITGTGRASTIFPLLTTMHTGSGWVYIASASADEAYDSRNGTRAGMALRTATFSDADGVDAGPFKARTGFESGSNTERAWVAGFHGNEDVFRAYGIEFATPTVPDWKTFFAVANGRLTLGATSGPEVHIFKGAGSPAGVVVANRGSEYHRTDGGAGTTLYVKESGDGTSSGWVGK